MKKIKLSNGLNVILKNRNSKTTSVCVTVNVGSNDETDKIRGISHFVEHMLFEGTKNRNSREISAQIEGIGGEIGAFTTNEKTCYHIQALNRNLDVAVDVLSDIILNPIFDFKSIEKERGVILSEVSMRYDQPRSYRWTLFQKTLFEKINSKHPIIGYEKIIKNISREDLVLFHQKYYVPSNIIITVCGDTKKIQSMIQKNFKFKKSKILKKKSLLEPKQTKIKRASISKPMSSSYMVLGYNTIPRSHKDSYVLDVIQSIIGRPLSGRLFDEFRIKRGLAYSVGAHNESEQNYGFFALYIGTEKKNLALTKKLFLEIIENASKVDDNELNEAKNYLEGNYVMENEDSQKEAENLADWELIGNFKIHDEYIKNIRKITKKDIIRVSKNYFKNNYTIVILKQKP